MRNVVSYLVYSLDGATDHPERWIFDHFDDDLWANLRSLVDSQDAVLLGRVTYEAWSEYWPGSAHEPFASFINETQKYVVSSTLDDVTWANSTLVKGSVADLVAELKAEPGKDIGVHGSASLVRSMLREGLIDELRLAVPPVFAGVNDRLFDDDGEPLRMRLGSAKTTSSGALLLSYHRRV